MRFFFTTLLLSGLFLIFCVTVSEAAPMRDMSLSVEDTMRQPSITYNSPSGNPVDIDPDFARQMREIESRSQQAPGMPGKSGIAGASFDNGAVGSGKSFMSNYCNSNANNQSCEATQRLTACQRFQSTTVDIQRHLDRVIECQYSSMSNNDEVCDGLDSGSIDLLKQYWQDEDSSYTILFLPDMVLNAEEKCNSRAAGKRQPAPGSSNFSDTLTKSRMR